MPQKRINLLFFLIAVSPINQAENTWTSIQPSYQQVSLTGFSRARDDMVLSTEVAGKVKTVFVDVGDIIAEHGNVSCLDDTFSKIDINSTKNDIELAKIDIAYYQKQVNRFSELVRKKNISLNQLDDVQRQLATAKRVKTSKQLLKQRQQEKLNRHCIKSPSGWFVEERYVDPGQWLDIGNPIVKVGNYSKLLVPFALSVDELNALKSMQQNLTVWLPEYQQHIPASIERISPAFDQQSRKIQVDLLLAKNLPVQRGGLRVNLILKLPDPDNIFLIDEKALDKRFEETWIKSKEGLSFRVNLLGRAENGKMRIQSPQLKAGEQFKIIHP